MLEPALAELARTPLDKFLETRARLARELRLNGEPWAAMEVEARRKPTAVVWALNQLAHRDLEAVERACRSTDALRALQAGGERGDADRLRAAAVDHRAALQILVRGAATLLRAAGVRPTRLTLERIDAALLGALADADAREALRRGRLTAEPGPPGFEAVERPPLRLVRPGERAQLRPGSPAAPRRPPGP